MYGCESWTVKKAERQRVDAFKLWCWIRLVRIPWTSRRCNQSILKEISPEAETSILWPPDAKSWLIWKDPDVGKNCGQEEKGMTEDEMIGRHHRLNGHGFGWTPGVGDGQRGLAFCGSCGHKELDTTERLNWTDCWTLMKKWLRLRAFRSIIKHISKWKILYKSYFCYLRSVPVS